MKHPSSEARPPERRSAPGLAFTVANLDALLAMQACQTCRTINYPPREVCQNCLGDQLTWEPVATAGRLLNRVALHHSYGEFFKRHLEQGLEQQGWPVAVVEMTTGPVVFAHLALSTFATPPLPTPGTAVQVFSHTDCDLPAILVATSAQQDLGNAATRREIAAEMGLA